MRAVCGILRLIGGIPTGRRRERRDAKRMVRLCGTRCAVTRAGGRDQPDPAQALVQISRIRDNRSFGLNNSSPCAALSLGARLNTCAPPGGWAAWETITTVRRWRGACQGQPGPLRVRRNGRHCRKLCCSACRPWSAPRTRRKRRSRGSPTRRRPGATGQRDRRRQVPRRPRSCVGEREVPATAGSRHSARRCRPHRLQAGQTRMTIRRQCRA
jgi:hypothetical protein